LNSEVRRGRLTLALCAAAALFEGFDTQSMGVAAPRMLAELGLSSALSGVIFSAAALGLVIGAITGGRIADVFGRRGTLVVSLTLFGLSSLLTAQAGNATELFLARLATGLGLGGAMPNFIALSSESAAAGRRLRTVTLVTALMPLGGALAGLMALGERLGWSWRSIFMVGGAGPLLVALLMAFWLPQPRAEATHGTASRGASGAVAGVAEVLFGPGQLATTLLLWGGFFFTQLVLQLMVNWLPSLIVGMGFAHAQASWASICFNVSGSVGAAILGILHAGRQRRVWVVATYAGMAVALAVVARVNGSFAYLAGACAFAGLFIVGAQLVLFALAPLYYATATHGTGVGAAVAAGRVGSIMGPLIAGALLTAGSASAAVLIAIVPFVALGGASAFALSWRPSQQA
jgi:AAHS family 3-hydroxyphenylpropionic acid transporter